MLDISARIVLYHYIHCVKTVVSTNFLVWNFCGKAQFPQIFGRIKKFPHQKISWNYGTLHSAYFSFRGLCCSNIIRIIHKKSAADEFHVIVNVICWNNHWCVNWHTMESDTMDLCIDSWPFYLYSTGGYGMF